MPLLPPTATYYGGDLSNDNYFLRKGQPLPLGSLVSPLEIFTPDKTNSAEIVVNSTPAAYNGSMTIISGSNVNGSVPVVGMTIRTSGENEATVEIGDNAQTNYLKIAGASGLSQVFDPVYNPVNALKSVVNVASGDGSTTGTISVVGNETPSYKGALGLNSGANPLGPSLNIITGRTLGLNTMSVEVGNNSQINTLKIAGASGLSQVNDPVYNPATAQQLVNILGPDITTNYPNGWLASSPNDGTIITSSGSASFSVSKTGLYMLQGTASMAPTTVSSGAFSLQATIHNAASPYDAVGGIVIGQPTPLSANEDYRSYYCWTGYVSLIAGVAYSMDVRMLSGGGVYLPPAVANNDKYADLSFKLINIA